MPIKRLKNKRTLNSREPENLFETIGPECQPEIIIEFLNSTEIFNYTN